MANVNYNQLERHQAFEVWSSGTWCGCMRACESLGKDWTIKIALVMTLESVDLQKEALAQLLRQGSKNSFMTGLPSNVILLTSLTCFREPLVETKF